MKMQYNAIKAEHPDCLLFYRLGDFYEMFDDDAVLGARELNLALTTRDRGKPEDERTPMCGVPYHSAEQYISKLIAKGYKVAVCEQMEDPKLCKGLVSRDIVRIISPGTIMETSMLREGESNYLGAVMLRGKAGGCAFADVSTGEVCAASFETDAAMHIQNEISRFRPRECVLAPEAMLSRDIRDTLEKRLGSRVEPAAGRFDPENARKAIADQYGENAPELDEMTTLALGALLAYLTDAARGDMSQLRVPDIFTRGRYMELDAAARRNLELTENLRTGEKRGSLLWVLDKTKTPMGGRMLRSWVERPLLSPVAIRRRLAAVEELFRDNVGRAELTEKLKTVGDIQRLTSRAVYGAANGRDMLALGNYLSAAPEIFAQLGKYQSGMLRSIAATEPLENLCTLLRRAICDEPPFSVREGGFIRKGFNAEVDRLHDILSGGKGLLASIETKEKERTGIRTLKIGYNKVFGYYIEVSNSFKDQVPDTYIRKQTLVNGERYITQELKDLEQEILTAGERDNALEYEIFSALRDEICAGAERIQKTAAAVAELDTLASLAVVAVKNSYCCPVVDDSGVIEIHDGRHPVVERVLKDALFVPNDTYMGEKENRVAIITGPNMAGKSTYMRQVALITLMAQIGSFVPARAARIGVVDRIFTRIGASDDLAGGQSTFMVEMSEVAEILRQATAHSLLILDEIGRGTSTFDGMSIARAVLEFCADRKRLGAKTLFATHYHELTELEGTLAGVKNYNIAIKKRGEDLVFLRKIIPGGADRSYGIEVAKLAGLPKEVVSRAKKILEELEAGGSYIPPREEREQVSLDAIGEAEVLDALRRAQPDTMSPIEAMQLLYDLKKKLPN